MMDKDRQKGMAKEVTGSIKETVGTMTGDDKMQAEGTAKKAKGKAQKTVGAGKDAARDALDE